MFTFLKSYLFPQQWYIIEGNIGCGKTTLITTLKGKDDIEVLEEPVNIWKNIKDEHGENILGLFYKNPTKYSYLFQTIVFKTRMMDIETKQMKSIRFSERSIWTDKNVFAKNCFELGYLESIARNTYDTWFYWLEAKLPRKPTGIFYLHADPATCLARIHKRNRTEESGITLEYIQGIHDKHEEWLRADSYRGIPIHIIDNSGDPSKAYEQVVQIMNANKGSCLRSLLQFILSSIPTALSVWFDTALFRGITGIVMSTKAVGLTVLAGTAYWQLIQKH